VWESIKARKWLQALERGAFLIIDLVLSVAAIKGAGSAAENAVNPPKNSNYMAGEGAVVPNYIVNVVTFLLRAFGVKTMRVPRSSLPEGLGGAFESGSVDLAGNQVGWMTLAQDATWYEFLHEVMHAAFWSAGKSGSTTMKEQFVYDMLQTFFWKFLSPAQQKHAAWYVKREGGQP
jgi:hypothetical protein